MWNLSSAFESWGNGNSSGAVLGDHWGTSPQNVRLQTLSAMQRGYGRQSFYSLWYDQARDRNHNLPAVGWTLKDQADELVRIGEGAGKHTGGEKRQEAVWCTCCLGDKAEGHQDQAGLTRISFPFEGRVPVLWCGSTNLLPKTVRGGEKPNVMSFAQCERAVIKLPVLV